MYLRLNIFLRLTHVMRMSIFTDKTVAENWYRAKEKVGIARRLFSLQISHRCPPYLSSSSQPSILLHIHHSLLPKFIRTSSKMAKTKDSKTASKAKSEVNKLSKVKSGFITKPSQAPAVKSKSVAKEVAAKAAPSKKSKKAPTPPSDSESESASAEESESGSDSEAEVEVKKPTKAAAKKEVATSDDSSDSSDSSAESESDSDASDDDSDNSKDSDNDSEDSDSSEEAAPAPKTNGAAKVAKADVSSIQFQFITSLSNIKIVQVWL
jgi:hypothetical protein